MPKGNPQGYISPLDETHLLEINDALSSLDALDELLQRTAQAEIDVSTETEEAARTRRKLLGIKRAFFPQA